MNQSYLGRGWPSLLRPDPRTRDLRYVAGPEKVAQAIWLILDTEPGERVMRPAFGCGLRRYLMQPNTVATRALIKHDVEAALLAWEQRIQLTSVDVSPGDPPSLVLISIAYVHVADRRAGNLIYPFDLE